MEIGFGGQCWIVRCDSRPPPISVPFIFGFKRCATLNCKGTKAMLERNKTDYECRTDTAWSNDMTIGMKVKSVHG